MISKTEAAIALSGFEFVEVLERSLVNGLIGQNEGATRAEAAWLLEIDELERGKLERVEALLEHEEIWELVAQGWFSVAMIKPRLDGIEKNEVYGSDEMIAEAVKEMATNKGFEWLFELNVVFDRDDMAIFYGEVGRGMIDRGKLEGWEDFQTKMGQGAVTVMLLVDSPDDGKSMDVKWREAIGATNPAEAAEGTIRKRFGADVGSNVVHGSDLVSGSVRREMKWVLAKVKSMRGDDSMRQEMAREAREKYGL